MSILYELPRIMSEAAEEYKRLLDKYKAEKNVPECEEKGSGFRLPEEGISGIFALCDNAEFLAHGIAEGILAQKVDLIYIDPPFFSGFDKNTRIEIKSSICDAIVIRRFPAYNDRWKGDMSAYLQMLAVRLMLMRDTLKETGSIFVHLDWHAVHPVRLIMDEIFGERNFINEIIWTYKSGGATTRRFARKHDTILFYSKSEKYKFRQQKEKSYNRGLRPYRFRGVKEFQDEIGWYTMVNQKDVWQIDMVGRNAKERLNYATQKPEALIRRIIDAVTDEGDLAADFFCGAGTLAAVAADSRRRFLCSDVSGLAISNAMKRPLQHGRSFFLYGANSLDSCGDISLAMRAENRYFQIISYIINIRKTICDEEIAEQVEALVQQDSLVLVDYWGTALMESDGRLCPQNVIFRERNGTLKDRLRLADAFPQQIPSSARPVIFTADIFGNIIFRPAPEC